MKRPSSLPVVVQVGALAALAVVMSQAVAFAVVVLAPEPRPAGFSIADAARALNGGTAETADGRVLRRRLTDHPVARSEIERGNPMALAIRAGLANSLDVPIERVAVSVVAPERRADWVMPTISGDLPDCEMAMVAARSSLRSLP